MIREACLVLIGHLSPPPEMLPPSSAAESVPIMIPDLAITTALAVTSMAPPVVLPVPATSAMAIDLPAPAGAIAGSTAAPPLT